MMTHEDLTFEQLLDWLDGHLPSETAAEIETLLATADATIHSQIAWLRAFESLSGSIRLAEPPLEVRAALNERFAQYAQKKVEQLQNPSIFQRIVATLRFDSAVQTASGGLRAGDSRQARQIIFSTAQADIALFIQPRKHDPRIDLFGQVMPNAANTDPEAFSVQLLQNSAETAIAMADDLGEFTIEAIDPGIYELILSDDSCEIILPVLELYRTEGTS